MTEALNSIEKPVNGSRVHVFGVAYKRDVNDLRESPALDVIDLLTRRGASVSYTDPYVARLTQGEETLESIAFEQAASTDWDCALVTTDHKAFDYSRIAALPLVVDTRNALKAFSESTIFRI